MNCQLTLRFLQYSNLEPVVTVPNTGSEVPSSRYGSSWEDFCCGNCRQMMASCEEFQQCLWSRLSIDDCRISVDNGCHLFTVNCLLSPLFDIIDEMCYFIWTCFAMVCFFASFFWSLLIIVIHSIDRYNCSTRRVITVFQICLIVSETTRYRWKARTLSTFISPSSPAGCSPYPSQHITATTPSSTCCMRGMTVSCALPSHLQLSITARS